MLQCLINMNLCIFAWTIALVYLIMELVTIFIARVHESRLGIIGALQSLLSAWMLHSAINTDSTIKNYLLRFRVTGWLCT